MVGKVLEDELVVDEVKERVQREIARSTTANVEGHDPASSGVFLPSCPTRSQRGDGVQEDYLTCGARIFSKGLALLAA